MIIFDKSFRTMQFKHPEILFALLLLIIPIIVHLFQLRRFKKVPFTNIKFLKAVELQTRKSSRIKKLLILFTRLLLFTALIIAFAFPYISKSKNNIATDTYIYLDNSFSMQAKATDGELLKRAVQDIVIGTSKLENIHLFTNDKAYTNLSAKDIKNTLLSIDYHPIKMDLNAVLFKIKNGITNKDKVANKPNNIFLVSDFQSTNFNDVNVLDSLNNYYITQLVPTQTNNISIDSVNISSQNNESITLKTNIKGYGKNEENISISLYNDNILAGKSSFILNNNTASAVEFTIPNTNSFRGKLQLDDGYLNFDNELFFSITKPKKINVTAIGENNAFLSKIYTENEFNFVDTSLNKFDYNFIEEQHLLVLNELENIPNTLTSTIKQFIEKGGHIVIIPPTNLNESYASLLRSLSLGSTIDSKFQELLVTTINFSHPLLTGVFEKEIENFQYPFVSNIHTARFRNESSILKFENGDNFISQIPVAKGMVYWLSSSIDIKNSNFKSSPLIVPIFNNFGLYSHQLSQLYYTIGKINTIEINAKLKNDDVLHLVNGEDDFIPIQQTLSKKIKLTTDSNPLKSGFYEIQYANESLAEIAYNYNREESNISSAAIKEVFKDASNITYTNTVNKAFTELADKYKTTNLWQLFLLLALLFLVIEVLLIKFLKS